MRGSMCVVVVAFAYSASAHATADEKVDVAKASADLKSKDVKVRLKATERLADLGEDAARSLCDAMLDTNSMVATTALVSLEKAHPSLYKPVSAMVLERSESKQADAVRDIGKLGNQGRAAVGLLIARAKAEITKVPVGKGGGAGRSTHPSPYITFVHR